MSEIKRVRAADTVAATKVGHDLPRRQSGEGEAHRGRAPSTVAHSAAGQLEQAAAMLRRCLVSSQPNLDVSCDAAVGEVVVTITDSTPPRVLRRIPADEALKMAERVAEGGPTLLDLLL